MGPDRNLQDILEWAQPNPDKLAGAMRLEVNAVYILASMVDVAENCAKVETCWKNCFQVPCQRMQRGNLLEGPLIFQAHVGALPL